VDELPSDVGLDPDRVHRRFRDGISFGVNYTLGLRFNSNTLTPVRREHGADGSYDYRADQAEFNELMKQDNLRRHVGRPTSSGIFPMSALALPAPASSARSSTTGSCRASLRRLSGRRIRSVTATRTTAPT
jgi:hypothetical protein